MGQSDHRQGGVRPDPQLLARTTMSTAQAYPPMLITGGLNDPRVTYWEPAKWAAKLRATKTDDNLLLLKINMGAGHGGKSGRWERAARGGRGLCLRPDAGAGLMTRPVFELTLHRAARAHRRAWPRQQCGVGAVDPGGRGGALVQRRRPGAPGRLFLGRGAARDRLSARRVRGRPVTGADLGRRGAARARGSTGTWNSSARTARSGCARRPSGRSSTRRAGGRSAFPPR